MDLSYLSDWKVILGRLTDFLSVVSYFWTHALFLDAHTLKSFNWSSTLLEDMISKFEGSFWNDQFVFTYTRVQRQSILSWVELIWNRTFRLFCFWFGFRVRSFLLQPVCTLLFQSSLTIYLVFLIIWKRLNSKLKYSLLYIFRF